MYIKKKKKKCCVEDFSLLRNTGEQAGQLAAVTP